MISKSGGAVIRHDLNTFVEEAQAVDKLFIGEQVCPPTPVDVKDGQYPKFRISSSELLNSESTLRAPTGTYGKVTREFEMDEYSTKDRGLEELVDDIAKKDQARFFKAEVQAAKFVYRAMRTAHESRVASLFMNSSNFTATAAAVAYTEANLATIDFVQDLLLAIDRLLLKGVVASDLIMSSQLWTRIRRTTILQNYLRGNRPTDSKMLVKKDDIASAFDLQNIYIGKAPYNTAKKGATASIAPIWGNTYFWVGQLGSGDPYAGGAARTLVWNEEGGLFVTESYRDESRRSDVVRVRQHTSEKIIDGTCGELITTSYA